MAEADDIITKALTALKAGKPFTIDKKDLPPDQLKAVLDIIQNQAGAAGFMAKTGDLFSGNLHRMPNYGEFNMDEHMAGTLAERNKIPVPAQLGAEPMTPEQADVQSRADAGSGYSFGRYGEDKLAILKKADPELASTAQKDPWGNIYVVKGGKKLYLNRPGASLEDAKELAAQGLATVPAAGAALLAGPETLLARLLTSAGVGAAGSVTADQVAAGSGSKGGIHLNDAIMAAGAGGVFEAASPLVANAVKKIWGIFKSPKYITKAGELTPEGASLVKEAGLDWDSLSAATKAQLRRDIEKSTNPSELLVAKASENLPGGKIRMTEGQLSGNSAKQLDEENLRKGALGDVAKKSMDSFDELQAGDIRRNVGAIGEKLDPSTIERQNRWGIGGEKAAKNLQAQEEAQRLAGNAAFKEAKEGIAFLPDVTDLSNNIANNADLQLLRKTQPELDTALKEFETRFGKLGSSPSVRELFEFQKNTLRKLETQAGFPKNEGLTELRKTIKQHLSDAAEKGLMVGDEEAVGKWLTANKLWAQYKDLWDSKDILAKITKTEFDPALGKKIHVLDPADASKLIFGASRLGLTNQTGARQALLTLRKQLPKNEWNALREETFVRALGWEAKDFAGGQPFVPNATKMKAALADLETKSPGLYSVIFNDDERKMLRQFTDVYHKATVPVKGGSNPSGTTAAMSRLIQKLGASAFAGDKTMAVLNMLAGRFFLPPFKAAMAAAKVGRVTGPGMTGAIPRQIAKPLPQGVAPLLSLPPLKGVESLIERYNNE